MAEGEQEDFRRFFNLGPGGVTETYVQAAWGRLSQGKKVLFHDRPGGVEAAIQAAADAGRVHGAEDVRRVVEAHYAARAAALPQARESLGPLLPEAVHALDAEPGPGPTDVPPGVPPPPPFVPPEHLAGEPDAALRAAQDATPALTPPQSDWPPPGPEPETPFRLPELPQPAAPPVLGPADAGAGPGPFTHAAVPAPAAADYGPGGGAPPWWDPALGAVVGAVPESPTPRWWDPLLGEVVEPGAGRRPEPPAEAAPAPVAPGAGHLAEAAALAEEAEGEPRAGSRPQPPAAPPVLGEADLSQDETWYHPFREPGAGRDAAFEGVAGGGEGPGIMAVLERIASGIDRLVDIMSQGGAGDSGAARFRRPDFGDGGPDWDDDEDDDPDVPASPSVDRYDLLRPGQDRVETSRPEGPRRPRQPKHHDEPGTGVG